MDITNFGVGCVKLSGKNLNVLCDPYGDEVGLGKLNTKADVVTLSTESIKYSDKDKIVIDGPGEYEVKGAMIAGVPAQLHLDEDGRRGTVYSILVDGINIVVLGNIAGKLDNKQLEILGKVDVLIVPVGGHGLTLDAEGAAELVSQFEPSYVIPVHYDDIKTQYPVPQDGVDLFLKEVGASDVEPVAKLKVGSKDMPEELKVVVLQRQTS